MVERFLKVFIFIMIFNLSLGFADEYRVIKVTDGDSVYLDFNGNGVADKDERVRLNGIDAFEVTMSEHLKKQMETYHLTLKEALWLGYLGRKFAIENLDGKYVKAKYTSDTNYDKYDRKLMSIFYDNDKSFEVEILKAGLATVYNFSNRKDEFKKYENLRKIKQNAKASYNKNLKFYDSNNNKYYDITSKEAQNSENILIEVDK